jgi:hypothetical protein
MFMITTILGGLMLLGKAIVLFIVSVFESLRNDGFELISLLILFLTGLLIFEGYKEIKNIINSIKYTKNDENERWLIKLADFFAVVVSAIVTFYLNNQVDWVQSLLPELLEFLVLLLHRNLKCQFIVVALWE